MPNIGHKVFYGSVPAQIRPPVHPQEWLFPDEVSLCRVLWTSMAMLGLPLGNFGPYSFQIGAATTAAKVGL